MFESQLDPINISGIFLSLQLTIRNYGVSPLLQASEAGPFSSIQELRNNPGKVPVRL